MIITGLTGAIVLPVAFLSSAFRSHFEAPMSERFQLMFFASLILMALHKAESFWFAEFDQCPVYLSQPTDNPRKALFMGFVPTFVGMTFLLFLGFLGPPWHLIVLTVWLGQGVHELHHLGKSLARKRSYPGVVTSVLFVLVMSFGLFPLWHDAVIGARGLIFYAYYAALPLVFLGFYFEDRRWIARVPEAVWNPVSPLPAVVEGGAR